MKVSPCGTNATGTIVFATARDGFAVIGADRLWHSENPGDPPYGEHRKVQVHQRLPIAVAMAGMCAVRRPSKRFPSRYVGVRIFMRKALSGVKSMNGGILKRIENEARTVLLPGVLDARNDPKWSHARHKMVVVIAMSYWHKGRSCLKSLEIADTVRINEAEGFILAPPSLNDFYGIGRPKAYGYSLGSHIQDPIRLAGYFHGKIKEGIDVEERIHGGKNRECGGGIDVAVVDAKGARFEFLAPSKKSRGSTPRST